MGYPGPFVAGVGACSFLVLWLQHLGALRKGELGWFSQESGKCLLNHMALGCSMLGPSWLGVEVLNCYPSWGSPPSISALCGMSSSTPRGTGWGLGEGVEGESSVHIPGGDIDSFLVQGVNTGATP